MYKQGISTHFKRVVAVTGGLFLLGALWHMPQGQPSAALLGFLLIALVVNTRCVISVSREWWRLSPNESLMLLAMVLFGGACAAGLGAKLFGYLGVNMLVIAAPLVFVGCAAWDAYRSNKYLRSAEPVRASGNGVAGEVNESEERFRSAFDYAAIGMA